MIRRKDRREGLVTSDYWGPSMVSPWSLLTDMDRIFDDFRSEWETMFVMPQTMTTDMVRQPLIDLMDNGKDFLVTAEIPGIKKDDLRIEVTERGLEISGETQVDEKKEDKESGYIRRERRFSKFYRSVPLPENVRMDKVEAELKDGVLFVRLPKAAPPEKKARKVAIK